MTTRSIDELVKLDSYQDMTDEEIDLVMNYRTKQAYQAAKIYDATAESAMLAANDASEYKKKADEYAATINRMMESLLTDFKRDA